MGSDSRCAPLALKNIFGHFHKFCVGHFSNIFESNDLGGVSTDEETPCASYYIQDELFRPKLQTAKAARLRTKQVNIYFLNSIPSSLLKTIYYFSQIFCPRL